MRAFRLVSLRFVSFCFVSAALYAAQRKSMLHFLYTRRLDNGTHTHTLRGKPTTTVTLTVMIMIIVMMITFLPLLLLLAALSLSLLLFGYLLCCHNDLAKESKPQAIVSS